MSEPISGGRVYQERARAALPAEELGLHNSRSLEYVDVFGLRQNSLFRYPYGSAKMLGVLNIYSLTQWIQLIYAQK